MTIRVEKEGWIVSGDTLEELEVGIEAVQRALDRAKPTKGHKAGSDNGQGEHHPEERAEKLAASRDRAIRFLEAIQRFATVHGVPAAPLVEATGAKGPKSLGIYVSSTNKVLSQIGLKRSTVYADKRTSDGKRWFSRPKIEYAIEKIRALDQSA